MLKMRAISVVFSTVFLVTFLSKLLAVTKETFFAQTFGASPESDAFIVASTFPFMVIATLAASIEIAVVAVSSKLLHAGNIGDRAPFLTTLLVAVVAVGGILTAFWAFFDQVMVSLLAPGFSESNLELARHLTRILLPCILLFLLIRIVTALIESKEKFLITGLSNVVFNGGVTLALLFPFVNTVEKLAYCTTVALSVQFILLAVKLGSEEKIAFAVSHRRINTVYPLQVLKLTGPNIAILILNQTIVWLERSLGSYTPSGNMTAYYFAGKIHLLAIGLLAAPLLTLWYPKISKERFQTEVKFSETFTSGIRWMNLIILPTTAFIMLDHREIVQTLFEYGRFTRENTSNTAVVLLILAPSLFFLSQKIIFERMCILKDRAAVLVRCAIFGFLLNAALDLMFFQISGILALAWGTLVSAVVTTGWMAFSNRIFLTMEDRKLLIRHTIKTLAWTLICVSLAYLLETGIAWFLQGSFFQRFAWIMAALASLIIYVAVQFRSKTSLT